MSDTKRTGSRDISELKQRLGLKKGAAPAAGQTRGNGGQAAGIAPPPGLNLPPPPGVQPAQPAIPSAADDPFGAMNAMAAVGTVQRAPEIVIVNDGKPVENVGSSSMGAKIAMVAIPGVLMLVVGIALGKIGTGASHYNEGLAGAKSLLANEQGLKKTLSDLDRVLDDHKAKSNFKPDQAVDKELTAIASKLEVKAAAYAVARNITNEGDLAALTLLFYGGVQEIKGMLDTHLKVARSDGQAFVAAQKAGEDNQLKAETNQYLSGSWRYAVVVTAPSCVEEKSKDCELPFGAHLVEIGPPVCDGKVNTSGKCPDGSAVTGFAYRGDPGRETFTAGEWQMMVRDGSDTIPTKKMLPLVDNGVIRSVLQGNEATASEVLYTRRLRTISERAKKLIQDANKLEPLLQTQANKGERFTFFM